MVTQNDEHENDAPEAEAPRGPWAGLLIGLLIGVLIGSLAGAVAMLLVAPQSGKRIRAKLRRQSHELREQAAETVGDAVEQAHVTARHITHDVRKQAEELEKRGQAMLDGKKGR